MKFVSYNNIAILSDRNVTEKEAENKLKYKKTKDRNAGNVEYGILRHTGNHWATEIVTKGLRVSSKQRQESIQWIPYKKK
jgi:hypothetical protein